jgi:hypothetical protein
MAKPRPARENTETAGLDSTLSIASQRFENISTEIESFRTMVFDDIAAELS